MTRIPEEQIEKMKREVSVRRLAESRGVKLKQHGRDLLGLCPFHDDREPSLVISAEKNLWHCLGACQTGGSVIDWVMKSESVSFRHAVQLLMSEHYGSSVSSSPPAAVRSTVKKLPVFCEPDASDEIVLKRVVDYYHNTLKETREALQYLQKRGLGDPDLIERFQLGYSNRTLGYRLPEKNRKAGAALRGQLQKLGILRESGHEHFSGSVVIPVIDDSGRVTEMYGRKVLDNLRKGTALHLYLPGAHRGVWNIDGIKSSDEVILCESLIDAMTFWSAGFRNVTASYGVEGFTAEHMRVFETCGIRTVLIAYDRDEAGDKAARKLSEKLSESGIGSYRIMFPHGMDANEYAQKMKPVDKSFEVLIRGAVWLGKGEPKSKITSKQNTESIAAQEIPEVKREPCAPKSPEVPAEITGDEIMFEFGERRYRVRGLSDNLSSKQLKVNIFVKRELVESDPNLEAEGFHVDTVELYSARQRAAFIQQASQELGIEERIVKSDLGKVLLKLESLQESNIEKTVQPKKPWVQLSDEEKREAYGLLKDPNLLDRILEDFRSSGVVGEQTNKLVGYLAAVSRKLEEPLAIVIQSSSSAGKSSLMESVLAFMPEEERVQYSAMTGQSLFYMGETDLQHKILAIAEQEGAHNASYALKLLQSEGELTIASTGKDPSTGRLVTQQYRVQGPVMIFMTTTAIEIDEELLNRCIVLTVDEGREQTRAIHELQRHGQTLEGLLQREDRQHILRLHQNSQRLLRKLFVANPYANELTFLDHQTRTRRDHMKYLTLIRCIALLHQYQREVKTVQHRGQEIQYIEVSKQDIRIANRLAHEVLGRSLDELPAQTRRLLGLLDEMVTDECVKRGMDRKDYRFSRRQVREFINWRETQTRMHLDRLVELEYLIVHRGHRGRSFVYELVYDGQGQDGSTFLLGLLDVGKEKDTGTVSSSRGMSLTSRVSGGEFAAPTWPQRGPVAGYSRGSENSKKDKVDGKIQKLSPQIGEKGLKGEKKNGESYPQKSVIAIPLAAEH